MNSPKEKSFLNLDIILILVGSGFYMAASMLINPLIVGFVGELGAGGTLMGLIGGVLGFGALLFRPLLGNLTDITRKSSLAILGLGSIFTACLGYSFSTSPAMVLVCRVINGFGYSCCSVSMSTWLSEMLPDNRIGAGMGMYGVMNALASAVGPALGVGLYGKLGYRCTFAIGAVCALISFIMVMSIKNKGQAGSAELKKPLSFHIVEPRIVPIGLIVMLFSIPYYATNSFLVTYIQSKGVAVNVSIFFPVYAIALLIMRFSMKDLFDKLSFGFFVGICGLCSALSMLALHFCDNNMILIAAAILTAASFGIMCSVSQSTAIILAGNGSRGLANSTYYLGLDLGLTLGPGIGGILYEKAGISFFYPSLMLSVPLILLVFLIHVKIMRKPRSAA